MPFPGTLLAPKSSCLHIATICPRWTTRCRGERQSPVGLIDFGESTSAIVAAAHKSSVGELIQFLKNPCRHDFITQREKLVLRQPALQGLWRPAAGWGLPQTTAAFATGVRRVASRGTRLRQTRLPALPAADRAQCPTAQRLFYHFNLVRQSTRRTPSPAYGAFAPCAEN